VLINNTVKCGILFVLDIFLNVSSAENKQNGFKTFLYYIQATCFGVTMEKNPAQSVLMKTVGEIRSAEEKYDSVISEAKEEADKVLRKAKEELAKEKAAVKEEITKYKNEKLKSGKTSIEKDVKKTIEGAKDEADKIKAKKLPKTKVISIGKSFIAQL